MRNTGLTLTDDSPSLVAFVSEGDSLMGLPLTVFGATRDDVLREVRETERLYRTFRKIGVGHAFYGDKLWLGSLDGSLPAEYVERVRPLFNSGLGEAGSVPADFTDAVQWNRVVKLIVRDSIAYAIEKKGKTVGNIVPRGPMVFSMTEVQQGTAEGTSIYGGLDFHRIHRASEGRVLVTVSLVFRAFDANLNPVRDTRVTSSYSHAPDLRWGTMARLAKEILPLSVRIDQRSLEFRKFGVQTRESKTR
jgi:hypothetical protein